jgi:hypothetical protein
MKRGQDGLKSVRPAFNRTSRFRVWCDATKNEFRLLLVFLESLFCLKMMRVRLPDTQVEKEEPVRHRRWRPMGERLTL